MTACTSAKERPETVVVVDDSAAENVMELELARAAPAKFAPALQATEPPSVRHAAARALSRLDHLSARAALTALLSDDDGVVRGHASFGLGQLDLVLDPANPGHHELRAKIENALMLAISRESQIDVGRTMVRALARVARGDEARALLARRAFEDGPLRAVILTAIGVGGARAVWPVKTPGLVDAVSSGLASKDDDVRRAAAYALFRQKEIPRRGILENALASERDPQALIHLLRTVDLDGAMAESHLAHPDWRVQVEALRALLRADTPVPTDDVVALARKHTAILVDDARTPGAAHVVAGACDVLVNAPRDRTQALFTDIVKTLIPVDRNLACACAVAHDAQDAEINLVTTCATSDVDARRLSARVIARSKIPATHKVQLLRPAVADKDVTVRAAVAEALAHDPGPEALLLVAAQLKNESDPHVAALLLSAYDAAPTSTPDPDVLDAVVARFQSVTTFEDAEPLMAVTTLLPRLRGFRSEHIRTALASHAVPQVAVAASGVPFGERPYVPLARVDAPPDVAANGVIIDTTKGALEIRFDVAGAPVTAANFAALAASGFFDGVRFHRVVPGFVVQGGDPRGDGSGGPGHTIPCENSDRTYGRGTVGMALAGKDTGGSQFFVMHADHPHLDGRYTVFGDVVSGMDVVDALTEADRIIKVRLVP